MREKLNTLFTNTKETFNQAKRGNIQNNNLKQKNERVPLKYVPRSLKESYENSATRGGKSQEGTFRPSQKENQYKFQFF